MVGEPVVYACRLSGCKADLTCLNQPAYEVAVERYGAYADFKEETLDIKHEGPVLAYVTTLAKKTYVPQIPRWPQ